MRIITTITLFFSILFFCFGCASVPPQRPEPQPTVESASRAFTQSGKASYYSDKLQNRKTASGQRYDKSLKTAAHRKLPFGTRVRVTNTANGKSVMVTVNDRGPFVKGRVIDLSRAAFSAIGNTAAGVLNVTITVVR